MNLTTAQAAKMLDVTPQAVKRAIERGRIKATKFGRDWAIEPEEVERYRAARWQRREKTQAPN